MSFDAIDSLDDARTATRSLLLPVSWRAWVRLAVVTFFVGGIGGGGGAGQAAQGAVPSSPSPRGAVGSVDVPPLPDVSPGTLTAVAVGVAAVALVLVVGHALVGAVMEFVLVESLRTRRVELRRPFRQFVVPGLRLFVFRTVVVLALGVLGAIPVLVVLGVLSVALAGVVLVPLLAVGVGLGWLVGLAVLRLTTDFVVPTMIAEGRTVLPAWRRLVPLLRREWREVLLYLVVRLALGVGASLVVGLVVGLVALVVAVPFLIGGAAVVVTLGTRGVGLVLLAGLAVAFLLVVVAASVVVQVPVVTYFRYYGLYLLGTLDVRLDLVRSRASDGSGTG